MCQITREAMEKQHTEKITLDIHLIQLLNPLYHAHTTQSVGFSGQNNDSLLAFFPCHIANVNKYTAIFIRHQ